jgi:V8-like Glu-specific endopeptidase
MTLPADEAPDYSTAVYPYDAVVYITDNFSGTSQGFRGSGLIIGPHTILTASHILWSSVYGAANNVSVYPAYNNGGSSISGQYITHYFQITDEPTISQQQSQFDYAIIDFAMDLSSYGSFGISTNYNGGTVHVTGYPASAGLVQTDSIGTVTTDQNYSVLDYGTLSTSPGNSGGPLWFDSGTVGNPRPYVVGVVSTGAWATEITAADLTQIQNWEAADSYLWGTATPTAFSDFNDDGTSDVLLQSGGTVVDWIIKNGAYQSGNVLTNGAAGWTVVGTGDFNSDGTTDVLLQNGATVVDWIMKNGVYQNGNVITNGAGGYKVVGTGDLNADGTADVVLQNGGAVVDWIMKNGVYQSGNALTNGATGWTVVGTGDFNADSTSDVLLQNGGTVVDWIMKNGLYQSGNVLTNGAAGWTVVGTGDFNGDGTSDVLLQNGGTVVDWIMGNGVYQSGNVITNGANGWNVVGTGDYNGDGTADVLLQNGGTVVDWTMKNGQFQSGNVITNGALGYTVARGGTVRISV